jgi:predicted CXXCH cytochrome family protein
MAFLLRRVATTADGRDIVRATPTDKASLIVGRDAGSDIHLPDLALNPSHARITMLGTRQLEVEALSSLGFDIDGRTTTKTTVDASQGAELRFGGHWIICGWEGGGVVEGPPPRITLTIARTDELSHSALDRDEAQAFSLRGMLPGRRSSAWVFSLFVLLAFLAAPIWAYMNWRGVEERPQGFHADASWSSGPLSTAHASLAHDCQSCHVDAFTSVTDSSCKSCHDDAHDHAPMARQLASRGDPGWFRAQLNTVGTAFGRPQGRCVECHTEHEGAGPMPATAQQFCTDCHDGMSSRLTDTRIGDAGDFGTSHPQFRPAVQVRAGGFDGSDPVFRRVALTPQTTDNSGLKFPHDVHLRRAGGVARMARSLRIPLDRQGGMECASCHRPTEDGVRFQEVDMERDCQSCHSLAFETVGGVARTLRHGEPRQVVADLYAYYRSTPPTRPLSLGGMARRRPGEFAQGQTYNIYFRETAVRPSRADDAVRAVFSRGGACYDCHVIAPPVAGNANWRVQPVNQVARYMNHGWFDHEPHKQETCSSCHAAARSSNANQLLIPGIANCRECHGGENSGAEVESPCASCHEYHMGDDGGEPWRPARVRARQPADRSRVITITTPETRRLYGGG